MFQSRTLRVDGPEWARLEGAASLAADDELTRTLAEHREAPVRASLFAMDRDRGVRTELSILDEHVLLVTRRLALAEGQIRVEPGAQVTFSTPEALWPALARTFPDVPQLRAPASDAAGGPDLELDLSQDEALALVGREDFALQIIVEAWTGGQTPDVQWARHWSVTDERLLNVQAVSDGAIKLVERPSGSIAAELRWALVGALGSTSGARAGVKL